MVQFFPYLPEYSSWEDWNGNLAIFYSQEPITFTSENNWKETAANVASLPTFQVFPVPDPYDFQNWQDWAKEFTLITNGTGR